MQRIDASNEMVWAALNDVEVLRRCIPGCEAIEATSDTEFKAKITVRIGVLKASLNGAVTLSDINPPHGYTITGSGSAGSVGFAKGSAIVTLTPNDLATLLTYEVKAVLGGKLALGAKVMDSTAKKLADEFFANLRDAVAPSTSETADFAQPGWFRTLFKKASID